MKRRLSFALCALVLGSSVGFAEEKGAGFYYPELEVVPRASQRVQDEAKHEARATWAEQLPIAMPALANVIAGVSALGEKADEPNEDVSQAKDAGAVALSIGAAWLGASAYLAVAHKPYAESALELKKLPSAKGQREELTRERLAEEKIVTAARLGRWVKYMSFLSNLAAGALVAGASDTKGAKIAGSIAAVSATLPLFFPTRWELVEDWHQDYKKKIYAPVTGVDLQRLPSGKWGPQWSVAWYF